MTSSHRSARSARGLLSLMKKKSDNYAALFEIPAWQRDNTSFFTQVRATIGKFTGHLHLLQHSELIEAATNKVILAQLAAKIIKQVETYHHNWGARHDKEFSPQLIATLHAVTATIGNYQKPSTPRP